MNTRILFLIILQLFSNCVSDDDCHDTLKFVNESSETIYYGMGRGDENIFHCRALSGRLYSNEFYNLVLDRSCWESRIDGVNGGSLAVYFFLEPPMSIAEDCDEDELNSKVIERKEFTIEQLRELNWTITYP